MNIHSKAPRGAFTLIEILVVIGIIALLAAILFPVFARVREGGRKTVCASNLKQLGLAFRMYADDNSGRYPYGGNYQVWAGTNPNFSPATVWTGATAHWVTGGEVGADPKNYPSAADSGLANSAKPATIPPASTDFKTVAGRQAYVEKGALFSYVKSASVYVCPSAPDGNVKKLSYSMNCAVGGLAASRMRAPNEIVLLVDEGRTLNDGYFWASDDLGGASTDSLFDGHNGDGNLLYADGHVKPLVAATHALDYSPQGILNKALTTGPIRFRDLAFGYKGANRAPSGANNTCGEAPPAP